MGTEKLQRKDFLKSLTGLSKNKPTSKTENTPPTIDPLFEKYSRKSLGNRQYSETLAVQDGQTEFLNRVGTISSGIAAYTGAWTINEVKHLLNRASYGAKKVDIDALLLQSTSAAVDSLLSFTPNPTLPSAAPLRYDTYTTADGPGYNETVATGADWTTTNIPYTGFGAQYYRRLGHQAWNWGVCINDARSVREKMQLFWYHFIPVGFEDIENIDDRNSATLTHDYMKLLRNNCLGNFKTLLKSISKTPAMLYYLSNHFSTAASPNENFARELLELFTIGKVPQNYTESDIQAASRVLSGWRIVNTGSVYPVVSAFNSAFHNTTGSRLFSSNFGNQSIPAGTNPDTKAAEFDAFFEMLFSQQATTIAKYICRRLYRFFVYYDIDTNIEANVITPLANLLITYNWEISPVLSTLLKSEHFYDIANRGVMIKSPTDMIIGLIRSLNVNTASTLGTTETQYPIWLYFQSYSYNYLEQGFGNPPTVAGWKAYYQDPAYYQNWINSETVQRRENLIKAFLNGFTLYGNPIKIDVLSYASQFPTTDVADPNTLVNTFIQYLLPKDIPASYKAQIKNSALLGGTGNDANWTTAWNNYVSSPFNTTYINVVTPKLRALLQTILTFAEYQLM
ncbi:MAG: DUF1800 family protein [Ferruginibacter sp.]|nr:DUF1800 family protein [Ferruginibacter sp.]